MDRMKEGVRGLDLDNVIISTASQQGLSLVAQVFINPGDTVIVEEPSYLGALQACVMHAGGVLFRSTGSGRHAVECLEDRLKEHAEGAHPSEIPVYGSELSQPGWRHDVP